MEEGVSRDCKEHLGGGVSQPDPPGSRSFSWFCKCREHGAQKGLVAGPSPAGPVPPPHLPVLYPSCLPVRSGDGNPRRDQKWQRGRPWQQRDPRVQELRVHPAKACTGGEATVRASEISPQHIGMAGFRGLPQPLRRDKDGMGAWPGQAAVNPTPRNYSP